MKTNYLGNVLALLRLLKQFNAVHPTSLNIEPWLGESPAASEVLRVASFVLDQIAGAEDLIAHSNLSDEAKSGLLQTTSQLKAAFSIQGLSNQIGSYFPALDTAISSFAILVSATGNELPPRPSALDELVAEVSAMAEQFAAAEIDPIIRETAKRHLAVLLALLHNVDALGVDSAMAAYFELVLRLKRATNNSNPSTKEWVSNLWPDIERWAGRLAIIDAAYSSAANLVGHAAQGVTFLQHLPPIPPLG